MCSSDLDLPLGLDTPEEQTRTAVLSPDTMAKIAEQMPPAPHERTIGPLMPDFNLDTPSTETPPTSTGLAPEVVAATDVSLEPAAQDNNVIDFDFGAPAAADTTAPPTTTMDGTLIISPENAAKATDLGVEIDLGSLDAVPATEQAAPAAPSEAPPTELT